MELPTHLRKDSASTRSSKEKDPSLPDCDEILQIAQTAQEEDLDQKAVLAFLGQAESYGSSETVDRLGLVDSILYFSKDHTYRVRRKRPMGFREEVDLEHRARLCEAELIFGKSVSPELYLSLRPVLKTEDGLQLGAGVQRLKQFQLPESMQLVDWVVQMQRYDFNRSFDKLGGLEDLSLDDCDALARYLVDLHSWSKSYQRDDWADWLGEHLEHFSNRPQLFAPQPGLRGLQASLSEAQSQAQDLRGLFNDRALNGHVQTLHGNLRLANFVALDCGPRMINPRLVDDIPHHGDILFDLAGLLIDLWSQGLRNPCNWIFSRYFGSLLDNSSMDGMKALGLLMFTRSIDRALALCPSDKACISGSRCSLASAFEGFVRTAMESALNETRILVVLGGKESSSKTEFAQSLAPVIGRIPGALWLSSSHERSLLDPGGKEEGHQSCLPDLVQDYMLEKARYGLEAGYSILLECPGTHPACLTSMAHFADAMDAVLVPLWFNDEQESVSQEDALARQQAGWHLLDGREEIEDLLQRAHGHLDKACERTLPDTIH